jgi:hypothetical protein
LTEADAKEAPEEERRQLRPYRRFVRVVFFVFLSGLCFVVLRGIIRSLDRMPSTAVRTDGPVDDRALRACAEDLERLERRLRTAAGELLAGDASAESWQAFAQPYELERLGIVARCNLEADSSDPVVRDLKVAASALEDLARSYALVYDRHKEDGLLRSRDVAAALQRANDALRSRR